MVDTMLPQGGKIKITEDRNPGNILKPRFQISYGLDRHPEELLAALSFEILTCLKGSGDLLVEINSSLLLLPEGQREECAIDIVRAVKVLGLPYKYRKSVSQNKGGIFSLVLGNTSSMTHEILIQIPSEMWQLEKLRPLLPVYGVRYHLCKEGTDTLKLLEEMYNGQLLDEEKTEFIHSVVFDCSKNGQMGIFSDAFTLGVLKVLLR